VSPVRHDPEHNFHARDVLAGLSVALVLIPQSMAYAELAGMPGKNGLYAAALPLVAAAFFASSPYLQTGPGALTALLTLGALVPLAQTGSAEYVALAALLALLVGLARVGVGLFRAGWLSYLMSRPMLTGFTSGAAILIIASQIPGGVGSAVSEGGVLARALWALSHPSSWELASIVLCAATVAIIRGGRSFHPLLPGVLVAAAVGWVFSVATGYTGPRVGEVVGGLPRLTVDLPWSRVPTLVLPAAVIALVGFAEAASIGRLFASEDRDRWDPDREFVSQGAANLVAGLTGGFPVGGSFARSSLNRLAGARSRWSGLVSGVAVLVFLPFAGVLEPLPRAVLSGIVIAAVWNLLKPREFFGLWSLSRPQALVGWSTAALTLALAPHVEHAVLLGILTAGAVHLWRELSPGVEMSREGGTLHLHLKGVLWFGSAAALEDEVFRCLSAERDVSAMVLHCGGLGRIDLTGALSLAEIVEQVRAAGLEARVEGVPFHARRVLTGVGVMDAG